MTPPALSQETEDIEAKQDDPFLERRGGGPTQREETPGLSLNALFGMAL